MKILYKFATRGRPEKFFEALDNIICLSASKNFQILVTIDQDDRTMNNVNVAKRMLDYPQVICYAGMAKTKVEAINMHINNIDGWDILCNHSDDMTFIKEGFDIDIMDAMPSHLDAFIHFPDQYAKEALCTYSILGRVYYSRTNYIYHPAYKSLWCDNEATEVAKRLNRYVFVDKQILLHEHPAAGYGRKDELLRRNEKFFAEDKKTYLRRLAKNFDL